MFMLSVLIVYKFSFTNLSHQYYVNECNTNYMLYIVSYQYSFLTACFKQL